MKQFIILVALALAFWIIVGAVLVAGVHISETAQKIAHNEQYITALQSQVESLADRVEQLEGRE